MTKRRGKKRQKAKTAVDPNFVMVDGDTTEPTPERMQHYGETAGTFKTASGRIVARLSPVEALYEQDEISPEAYLAAGRYLADWDKARFSQRVTADYSRGRVDGGGQAEAKSAARMDAEERLAAADAALPRESVHALRHMLLDNYSMTAYGLLIGSSRANAATTGKSSLRKALNRLATHYAPSVAPPKPRRRAFMQEGTRPAIQGADEAA